MQQYFNVVQNQAGVPVPGAQVNVYLTGTTNPATLYSDDGVTPTTNPVFTDNLGRFNFFIADGRYDMVISGARISTFTVTNVEIADVTEFKATDSAWATQQISFTQQATPATPASGSMKVYGKSDDQMYWLDDNGIEHRMGAEGPVLPNTPLAFSTTPNFVVSKNISYSMTLTGNVTSSTTSGSPVNGQLLSLTLVEDAVGSRTFVFPANFVFPVGYAFDTVALHTNALTFKYDGTNWNLISNSGSGGGGGTPGAPFNSIQKNNTGAFGASTITDTGSLVTIANPTTITGALQQNADAQFKGPSPWVDIRAYGARAFFGSAPNTTATINSGSPNATLASGALFQNGDGVAIIGAGVPNTLSTPAAPTVTTGIARYGSKLSVVTPDGGVGGTTYCYSIVARTLDGQLTPGSTETCTAVGQATLGPITVNITSWTRSGNIVTFTLASPTTLVANAMVRIIGADASVNGNWNIQSISSSTVFSIITAGDTANGAPTGGTGGTARYYNVNRITWANVTNAYQFYIYGRVTGGTKTRIGTSYPQNTAFAGFSTHNSWDDYGTSMGPAPAAPIWVPNTVPAASQSGTLSTTIVSGGGTNNVVLANNAGTSVAGVFMTLDNTPAVNAAIAAAATSRSSVHIPIVASGGGFPSTYPIQAFTGNQVGLMLAGDLDIGDTMYFNDGVSISGMASPNSVSGPAFGWGAFPALRGSGAFPMLYSPIRNVYFSYLTFINQNDNGLGYLQDSGGIPSSTFDHINFASGSGGGNDYNGLILVYRGANGVGGSSNWQFDSCSFVSSLPNGSTSDTPIMYFSLPGMPMHFSNSMFSDRGIAFDMGQNGAQLIFDNMYIQGPVHPFVTLFTTQGAFSNINIENRGVILDSAISTFVSYHGFLQGYVTTSNNVSTGSPLIVQGAGGVTAIVKQAGGAATQLGTTGYEYGPSIITSVDGINSQDNLNNPTKQFSSALQLSPKSSLFVSSLPTVAPTCSVSAGGTVPVGSYNFVVAPVFANRSEGTGSPRSNTCTTSGGNQTITINWTAVAGAVGYNFYMPNNGQSLQSAGTSPTVNGGATTSFVWSGVPALIGEGVTGPGGGPTMISRTAVLSNAFQLPGLNGSSVNGFVTLDMPTATAQRSIHFPDASGTVLLDATLGSGPNVEFYDNFNRANGGVGANYTNTQNTLTISTNQYTGGSAGAWNSANLTGPGGYANDQYAAFTLSTIGGGNAQVNVGVRMQAGTFSGYTCGVNTNSNTFFLQKFITGSSGNIASQGGITPTVGEIVILTVTGSNLSCSRYLNGTLLNTLSGSDSAYTSGSPGLAVFSNTSKGDNFNAGSLTPVAITSAEQDWTNVQHYPFGLTLGNDLSTVLVTSSGNSGRVAQSSGTLTSGNVAKFDANGNVIDGGFVAGQVPLSGLTAATGANSINNVDNAQTWNWALTTAAKTAFTFTENTAATNGAGNQYLGSFSTIAGSTAVPLQVVSSLTGTQTLPTLSITPTWNTSGVVDAALFINPTNTGSGAGSLLIDAKLGGTSQWKVDKAGNVTQLGTISAGSTPPACTPGTAGGSCLNEGSAPSAGANYDTLYASSADHMLHQNLNNGGDLPVPNRQLLTSAYTNATTTASNISGLSFSVAASANYSWTCHLYYSGSAGTAGLDITVTGPAAPTSVFYSYDEHPTATTIQSSVASAFSTKLTGAATVTASTNLHAVVTLGLQNGANAGTVQLQGSATGAGTVTVQAGSFCTVA